MELAGPWEATTADEDRRRTWLDSPPGTDPDIWSPIQVPGHWRCSEPWADSDGPLLYRTRFEHDAPEGDERLWLRFEGVFYQGDVWLNGGYVGDTEGYFFPHTFEVTEALSLRRDHQLGIEVTCGSAGDRSTKRNITGAFQHSASIDPAWNPGGIWRPVHIERTGPVRIRHLRVLCTDANESIATVSFRAVLDAAEAGEVVLRSAVGDTELIADRRLAAGENQVEWQMRIDEPELWWPHALGDPILHDVVVEVAAEESVVSHRVERRIGLREVHLRAWVLHVNGERLFLKGADLGPTRAALAEADPGEVARDVTLAREANLDLIRVHTHVSRPELYDAADEAGMLVWQDFPLHRGYNRGIRKQAQRQAREMVDLLGHHPSIVVWCGHNEPFTIDDQATAAESGSLTTTRLVAAQELPSWNRSILDRSVKRAIDTADGTRPVVSHSGVLPHPPQLDGTDSHLWLGWYHGEERDLVGFARLVPRQVRFVSEFGAQSVPSGADFCQPERWPDLDWERLSGSHGLQRSVLEQRVRAADHPTFEAWRDATQRHQADLVRHYVETLRRLKYRPCGGFAMFTLTDPQPAISMSALDHNRAPKAAYLALSEACRPVIVVADRLPPEAVVGSKIGLDLHVVSDLRVPMQDIEVQARLRWNGGEQRWRFGGDIDADTCQRVGTLQVEVPDAPGQLTLDLRLTGTDLPEGDVERIETTHIVRR